MVLMWLMLVIWTFSLQMKMFGLLMSLIYLLRGLKGYSSVCQWENLLLGFSLLQAGDSAVFSTYLSSLVVQSTGSNPIHRPSQHFCFNSSLKCFFSFS